MPVNPHVLGRRLIEFLFEYSAEIARVIKPDPFGYFLQ